MSRIESRKRKNKAHVIPRVNKKKKVVVEFSEVNTKIVEQPTQHSVAELPQHNEHNKEIIFVVVATLSI